MTFESESIPQPTEQSVPEPAPTPAKVVRYYGDEVRVLFFVGALVLFISTARGVTLPVSTLATILIVIVLAISIGTTNPRQLWVHWLNALVAVVGTFLFGSTLVEYYRNGINLFDFSLVYIETLTLLSLAALYFTMSTLRGLLKTLN